MDVQEMMESVTNYLSFFGSVDFRIISAMKDVDRGFFINNEFPYEDVNCDIEYGEMSMSPSIIARMLSLMNLNVGNSVLNVGSGSGWPATVMSLLVSPGHVLALESNPELLKRSIERSLDMGVYENLKFDGSDFYDLNKKFDKIIFTCGILKDEEQEILNWVSSHLKEGGISIVPFQDGPLIIFKKNKGDIRMEYSDEEYCFTPLLN